MYDVLVIGAGPAGMTAAIYAVRGGKKTLMVDELSYGGQIINTPEVDNYPGTGRISGFELAQGMYEQASALGAEMDFAKVNSIEKQEDNTFVIKTTGGKEYASKAVILATGVKNRPLGVDREDQLKGAGISYCATCDGAFYQGLTVAVMGGGNTALEDAEYLSSLAEKVYIVHRRDKFRGDEITVKRLASKPNVEFVLDSVPEEIVGETRVEGIKVRNKVTGEIRELKVDGIFVAFGHIPVNSDFEGVAELDESGFFNSGENCKTKTKGVFVAGDCRAKQRRQLVTAASDGAVAAMETIEYLNSLEA